jgi:hypothetical protein
MECIIRELENIKKEKPLLELLAAERTILDVDMYLFQNVAITPFEVNNL